MILLLYIYIICRIHKWKYDVQVYSLNTLVLGKHKNNHKLMRVYIPIMTTETDKVEGNTVLFYS